jgi:hypothetical protein
MKVFLFVLAATIFEAVGDALIRVAIHQHVAATRVGIFVVGAVLLALYGTSLNLAPVEFATVTGIYVATLFVVFQITNYFVFRTLPTLPVIVGGGFIVVGGLIISLWK